MPYIQCETHLQAFGRNNKEEYNLSFIYCMWWYQSLKFRVVILSIFLLTSFERFLSPYNKSCMKTLLERLLIWANGCDEFETPARRSHRKMSNEGQKHSVPSILSIIGHIEVALRQSSTCSSFNQWPVHSPSGHVLLLESMWNRQVCRSLFRVRCLIFTLLHFNFCSES